MFCQLDALRHCLPSSVRRTLEELPESLDETYQRIVMDIKKGNKAHAYRMLQCLTVAIRPLSVDELAGLLAFDFDASMGGIPKLNPDWRWQDHEQAVLSVCSSLITIVVANDSRVVQFSHFSVKEFLMSDRLAKSTNDISQYHIVLEDANTVTAQACLGVLLRDSADQNITENVSLAGYAARHWVTHAQVENVAPRIRNGMQHLFDPNKPYFSAWVRLHDVDNYGFSPDDLENKRQPQVAPLYYAALCGLNEIVTKLVHDHPQCAVALCGGCGTALHAASFQGHLQVVRSLLHCGVDVDVRGLWNWTPLQFASRNGYVNVVQCLLDHGADANSRGWSHITSLSLAAVFGHLDIVRVLLGHHADVNCQDIEGLTPLHNASSYYHSKSDHPQVVELLLEHGANPNARDNDHKTPLHLVPSSKLEVACILLKHGADVDAEDKEGRTPLLAALANGHNEIARLLSECRSK